MTELVRSQQPSVPELALLPGPRVPRRGENWLLQQLPMQMLTDDFFVRFVSIFQNLGSRLLEDADQIDTLVDLAVTTPAMVRWMGTWIGTEQLDDAMGEDLQRRLVASAARTLVWRGTTKGLHSFLELLSGGPVALTEGGGVWRFGEAPSDPAWVRMEVVSTGPLEVGAFVALVRDEIPAHVRAELRVAGDVVWDSEDDPAW